MRSSTNTSHLIHSSRIQLQYCHVGNQATDCKLGLFQDAEFAGHDRFNINLRWCSVYIWITYVCADFMACKKQTGVSHSSTEAEIISHDAGFRMEGIPAMKLWDTVIDSLHPQAGGDFKPVHQTHIPKHHDTFGEIDYVLPNARLFSMRTALYISEGNKAVKKNKKRAHALQSVMYHAHIVLICTRFVIASI